MSCDYENIDFRLLYYDLDKSYTRLSNQYLQLLKLSQNMYYAAKHLTTDVEPLKKAMKEYYNFVNKDD